MVEEDYILKRCGKTNPFDVPEGYFASLNEKVMDKLPELKSEDLPVTKVTVWDKAKPWVYMAAMFAGIALMFGIAEDFVKPNKEQTNPSIVKNETHAASQTPAATCDMTADYCDYVLDENSNMDDYSMYQYLEEVTE